jgi:hypothetical protein
LVIGETKSACKETAGLIVLFILQKKKQRVFANLTNVSDGLFFLKKEPKTLALRGYKPLTWFCSF